MADVVVVGASNTDLVAYVPRLPVIGETLHGSKFQVGFGGKGANQCIMAAKLGIATAMVTKLGEDSFGRDTLANFKDNGVLTDHVTFTDAAATGVAPIAVDSSGRNSIVIVNGANDYLTGKEIANAKSVIQNCKLLICQLEIKQETTLAALKLAKELKVPSLFNLAPAQPSLPDEFFTLPTYFCLNESEAAMITGIEVSDAETACEASKFLREKKGAGVVILTLGEHGTYISGRDVEELVPTKKVNVVDTAGAGDCFIGAFAFFVTKHPNMDIKEQVRRSNQIAAVSVQGNGTQSSYPVADALPKDLLVE